MSVSRERREIRVVSYNIKHGLGMDGRIDLERIAQVISGARPDLVAAQEVDRHCKRSREQDVAAELGRLLGMQHAFGKSMDFDGGEYGMAVLSRHPIERSIHRQLPDGAEPRCALEIVVRPAGMRTPVSLVCVHMDRVTENIRLAQVTTLLESLRKRANPVILAGDFNGERTDKSMQLLAGAGWTILEKDGAKTFPSDNPKIEIDFIALRGFAGASATCHVMDEPVASDHRPVCAVITMK
jgi:endonuclease/exonuclease/phosphatase family metal-dependent hydrolase